MVKAYFRLQSSIFKLFKATLSNLTDAIKLRRSEFTNIGTNRSIKALKIHIGLLH